MPALPAGATAQGFAVAPKLGSTGLGADVVYAKAWGSMLTTSDHDESAEISAKYQDWIVDPKRMEMADRDAIYMHPLPADRNVEVADEVIDGRWSRVFDQAENRLHGQKAVMALTM